jgi:hypothetical protein
MIESAKAVAAIAGCILAVATLLRLFFNELKIHLKEEFATKQDFKELRYEIKQAFRRFEPRQTERRSSARRLTLHSTESSRSQDESE